MFNFIIACIAILPWFVIALFAALALRRQKQSAALRFQTFGAASLFVGTLAQMIVVKILHVLGVSQAGITPVDYIFGFLLFLSLAAFALGYCLERLARNKPAQVTATPA
jgi:hypothetical protein